MANYFRTFVESSIPSWLESLGCLAPADMEFRWPTTTIYTAPLKVVLLCYGLVILLDLCNFGVYVYRESFKLNYISGLVYMYGKKKQKAAPRQQQSGLRHMAGMRRRYYISYMNSESNQAIQMYIINLYQSVFDTVSVNYS